MNEKWTFKPLLNKNRCVIIVNGFYEWNTQKVPFICKPKKGTNDYFLIAALYGPNDELIVLTRESTTKFSVVHHRMVPILLIIILQIFFFNNLMLKKIIFFKIIIASIIRRRGNWYMVRCWKICI